VVIGAAYAMGAGAAYAVVIGAAYVIAGAATMEYEGMNAEVVASGMRAGNKGATSTSGSAAGAGAGADFFFFLVALFLDFWEEAATPMQTHDKAMRSTQATTGRQNPAEPEAVEPRLAWEPEESPDVKEADEPPLHGATVVGAAVGAAVSFAMITGATGAATSGSGAGVAKAPAMPPAIAAAPAAAPTPIPIFCGSVKPFLTALTVKTVGAQGSAGTGAAGVTVTPGVVVCGAHGS